MEHHLLWQPLIAMKAYDETMELHKNMQTLCNVHHVYMFI